MKAGSTKTSQGKMTTNMARGQKLVTPSGKDSSCYSGGAKKEEPSKIGMKNTGVPRG